MIQLKRFWYFFCLLAGILLSNPEPLIAQQNTDISSIKVDELSDEQLQELVKRANEAGLSTTQFLQMAQMRGMSGAEIEKLRKRLEDLDLSATASRSTNASKREPRRQIDLNEITQGIYEVQNQEIVSCSAAIFFIRKTGG